MVLPNAGQMVRHFGFWGLKLPRAILTFVGNKSIFTHRITTEVVRMIESDSGLEASFTFERERGRAVDEPPFRLLVLGDWSGSTPKKDISVRRPLEIDRDNFDDLIARFASEVEIQTVEGTSLDLTFTSIDDFHPDQIFERLPIFEKLRVLRRELLDAESFGAAAREVRSWMHVEEEPPPPKRVQQTVQPSENLLDAILSGSTGAAVAPRPAGASEEIADLVSDLVRPHLVSVDENEQAALLAAVDAATSDLMRNILHDSKFQKLESAWRGLYLLIRRAETSSDLKIFIYDVGKPELAEDLRSVTSLDDSALYKILVEDPIETPGGEPWAVVAANYGFGPSKDDIAALIRIAKIAAAANAPFISHMRPEVLGVSSLADNFDPRQWDTSEVSDAGKLWTALRGIPEAEFLGMTIPRFLARLPYGRGTDPLESFSFEEVSGAPDHDEYLWSNGTFITALLLAQTYRAYGWEMRGRFLQDIERLPTHVYESGDETVYQPCAEVLLTQNAAERLMDYGLMPLITYKNSDHVKLGRFQSVSDTALRGRWT
jgi:type VI secretion system protein ImpC